MNSRQIEKILERYFNGESSLEEEKILRDFFSQDNIPPHLLSLKKQFEYFSEEQKHEYLDESFDEKILNKIEKQEGENKRYIKRRYLYSATGIAASILILLSIFFKIDPLTKKAEDTFSQPYDAFMETKKALLFVSNTLNKGTEPVDKVASFDDGITELSKISSFETGMNEARKISTFHENQMKILNHKN